MTTDEKAALNRALGAWVDALDAATIAAERYIAALNNITPRQWREIELGYRVPDWIWRVWEQQREQFGSGNGRVGRG